MTNQSTLNTQGTVIEGGTNTMTVNVINPIQSVSQVIEKLKGFKGIGVKNFKCVIEAVAEGSHGVVEILENPVELAGVAPQQAHHFKKFLESIEIPKKLRRIKNIRVIVAQADLETINDELVSERDYSDFGLVGEDTVSGYKEVSGSYAFEMLAPYHNGTPEMITLKKNIDGEVLTREVLAYVLPHVCFINASREEEGDLEKKISLVKWGIGYKDHEGNMRKFLYTKRSPSQERVVQFVAVASHILHPIDALNAVKENPFNYAKVVGTNEQGEKIYELDYVKAMKRFGLTLSNSVKSNFITIGKEITVDEKTGDIIVSGGSITIRIVEDIYSEVTEGKFKAFGKHTKKGRIFDAADEGCAITQVAGDGQMYMNKRTKMLGEKEFGRDFQNGITRAFSGFVKGNAFFTPLLEDYFAEDLIIPMSSFKASTDVLDDVISDLQLQFRVALFGTPLRRKKSYVELPYQFTHGMNLSAETMFKLVQPHLDRVKDMLKDPALISEYLGLDKLNDLDSLGKDEQEETLTSTLVSTLTTFLAYAPQSYVDVYLKEKALVLLQELVKRWKTGSIPVEANYRFLVMDPYAILDTYKSRGTGKEIRRGEKNKLYVNPKSGMRHGSVFALDKDGKHALTGDVALARNPQMTKGQSRVVYAVAYNRYVEAAKQGAFDGMVIVSCHDFFTIALGGADFNGDTALLFTQKELVEAVKRACSTAPAFLDIHFEELEDGTILFGDGCPFPGETDMSKYTFKFTKAQYTREFQMHMYNTVLEYVAETLKPNRIGELTNYATKIADAVRVMQYKQMDAYKVNDVATFESLGKRVLELEEMIDLLGWVQSWEIDRAKHGGAYEQALVNELAFIENPPEEVAYLDLKSQELRWFTPDWMAFRKGKQVNGFSIQRTNSVLSRVHQYIDVWEKENLVDVVAEMRADYMNNNMLSFLSSAIVLPENNVEYMALTSGIRRIKTDYNNHVRSAYERHDKLVSDLEFTSFNSPTSKEMKINRIKKDLKDALVFISEKVEAEMMALCATFEPELVGFAAYKMTYTVSATNRGADLNKPARGLSFPWIAKFPLLAAAKKASGNVHMPLKQPEVRQFDNLEMHKVNIGNFTAPYTPEQVASGIANWEGGKVGVVIQADLHGNMVHNVFIGKTRVASVYPEYITHFTNGMIFSAQVKDIVVKGKSVSFNLVSLTRY